MTLKKRTKIRTESEEDKTDKERRYIVTDWVAAEWIGGRGGSRGGQ